MKRQGRLSCLAVFALLLAANVRSQDPQSAQDTIFLRQGEAIAGQIAGFDGKTIRLRRFLPPLPGVDVEAAPIFASVAVLVAHI
jgi:hypothetical protein